MKVPFRLRRREAREAADALLVLTHDASRVFELVAFAKKDGLPAIHRTNDGFLIVPPKPLRTPCPEAIRLASLAEGLFVPIDAELEPALLEDEASGLVRERGLVILPGEHALPFEREPAALSELLWSSEPRREIWEPLPEPPPRAEKISAIVFQPPEDSVERVLGSAGPPPGAEELRPEDKGAAARAAGNVTLAAGKALVWLGSSFHVKPLSDLGARWVGQAVSWVPRLSESLLGRQEAALRDLLREFREGDLEKALRRALPVGEAGGRGGQAALTSKLPTHDLVYSLSNVLGGGKGPASIWFGGYDAQVELAREYRRAAARALEQGDHRRAAFIHAKLLRDYRQAASLLEQGGLHHDAAILYLEKVGDVRAAARAFETAGELDRALELYRQRGDHERAGDILKRMGEEDASVLEYGKAADKLVSTPQGHRAAGELMLAKTGRSDLALGYFEAGWAQRPQANGIVCGVRVAQLHAQDESPARLVSLVEEAERAFAAPGNDVVAGHFYGAIVKIAEGRDPGTRDELKDRALLGVAVKLRQRAAEDARPGNLVSAVLGQGQVWPAALVTDARYAFRAEIDRPKLARSVPRVQAAVAKPPVPGAKVTAIAFAPLPGEVFLGLESGEISCFRAVGGDRALGSRGAPIRSLAVDAKGEVVIALREFPYGPGSSRFVLEAYAKLGNGRYDGPNPLPGDFEMPGEPMLLPVVGDWGDIRAGLWNGEGVTAIAHPGLVLPPVAPPCSKDSVAFALILRMAKHKGVILFDESDDSVWFCSTSKEPVSRRVGWHPSVPAGSSLTTPALAWQPVDEDRLEIASVQADGKLAWATLHFGRADTNETLSVTTGALPGNHLAAAFLSPGLLAGVLADGVVWQRTAQGELESRTSTHVALPLAVACFPSHATGELLVVNGDASIVSVPFPTRS